MTHPKHPRPNPLRTYEISKLFEAEATQWEATSDTIWSANPGTFFTAAAIGKVAAFCDSSPGCEPMPTSSSADTDDHVTLDITIDKESNP